jgi:hypothetical protein
MKNGSHSGRKTEFTVSMHSVSCRLESSCISFMEYARSYLNEMIASSEEEPVVKSTFRWGELPGKPGSGEVLQRGRRLLQEIRSEKLYRLILTEILDLPGLQIELRWEEGVLLIDAYYRPESRLARAAGRFNPYLPRVYVILVYYLVYFPLVYSLYLKNKWHLFHAGAVEKKGSGWVLAGLPGSGKSTFTLSLLSQQGTSLLSDNLLMFDESQVYACPEPLHLGRDSIKVIEKSVLNRLENRKRKFSHDRNDFCIEENKRAWSVAPNNLVFLGLAERGKHRTLTNEMALERLVGYDRMAKEVNAYEQFAASLDLLVSEIKTKPAGRVADKNNKMAALLSRMNCWDLWIKKDEKLSFAWNLLEDMVESKEQSNEFQYQTGRNE